MARNNIYPPSVTPGTPKLGKKPDGWVETTYGDVLKPVFRRADLENDQEYQLVIAKRNRGGVVPRSVLRGSEVKTKTQYFIRRDDFLIAKRQIIHGACGIVPPSLDGAIVSNEYAVLNVKQGLLLDYLRYYCHTVYFQQTCFQSSIGVDVEKMVFRLHQWFDWKLYLPPLPEQRKIAAILSTWDEAIALTERLIEALQARKRGLMQRLLTGQVRFPGFTDEWRERSLSQFGRCIRGVGYKPETDLRPTDQEHTVRLLRANNIAGGRINLGDLQYVVSDRVRVEQYLLPNDIAICMASGSKDLVGKTAPFQLDDGCAYTVGAFCAIFRPADADEAGYVDQLFRSEHYSRELLVLTAGSSINNLKPSDVEGIEFLVPVSKYERHAIARILSLCDEQLDHLSEYRIHLTRQKMGLMQRLLTGQVRVKVDY